MPPLERPKGRLLRFPPRGWPDAPPISRRESLTLLNKMQRLVIQRPSAARVVERFIDRYLVAHQEQTAWPAYDDAQR